MAGRGYLRGYRIVCFIFCFGLFCRRFNRPGTDEGHVSANCCRIVTMTPNTK